MPIEILMFTGPNCSACNTMKPIAEKISNLRIVDVTEDHALAAQYGIRGGLPTFVKLVDGDYQDRLVGAQSQSKLTRWSSEF